MMTQKTFIALAEILNAERAMTESPHNYPARFAVRNLTLSIADVCAANNPRFKRGTFYRAAGFPELTAN